eukprot:2180432-Rhodomonas_salina.3
MAAGARGQRQHHAARAKHKSLLVGMLPSLSDWLRVRGPWTGGGRRLSSWQHHPRASVPAQEAPNPHRSACCCLEIPPSLSSSSPFFCRALPRDGARCCVSCTWWTPCSAHHRPCRPRPCSSCAAGYKQQTGSNRATSQPPVLSAADAAGFKNLKVQDSTCPPASDSLSST